MPVVQTVPVPATCHMQNMARSSGRGVSSLAGVAGRAGLGLLEDVEYEAYEHTLGCEHDLNSRRGSRGSITSTAKVGGIRERRRLERNYQPFGATH